jgi:hypothetical protein
MYHANGAVAGSAISGGALATTGFDSLWMGVAAFAMVALGGALLRLRPRKSQG